MRRGLLEIRLLGQYEVTRDGEPVEINSRPSRLLFAYLALTAGKHHPRERLAGLIWPDSDESSARGNLRQALWRLRKAVGEACLLVDNRTIAFDSGCEYWSDTAVLEERSDQVLTEAVAAYAGELLPGYYEEWVLLERERLRAAFEEKMQRLLDTLEQAQLWADANHWAERWIAMGQVPEPAYRALMISHAAQGDLAAAAAAYERCATALRLEVGVDPSPETRELYDRLIEGDELSTHTRSGMDSRAKKRPPQHNLPHQSTAFIGRERELAQLRELLASVRLLTLVGSGGTGKTRLALEAVSEMVGAFRNGVYFVSLAPIESTGLIVQAIAETIGFPLSSHEDPLRQLLRHLQHRQYLLLLDNFDHLLSGASLASEIVQHARQVTILATSREKLNLHEETIFRIDGLAYPPTLSVTDACDYGAVKLFVEGARHVRADFSVSREDLPHIIQICRLLEGMPLGILLASAWAEMLSAQEIASEITRSLDFLRAEWRDMPERHQSVRAAFEPSWQRLTERQRELFAALSLFRGGLTRDAASVVAGASLQDLANLVSKSLLRRELETGRYQMHDLLRQYAGEHLQAMSDTKEAVARKHAVYFADLIQQLWLKLIGSEQLMALAAIDADLENLRQSWRHWLKQRDAPHIRMYIYCFRRVYDLRGWYKTGVELFGEAIDVLRPVPGSTDEEVEVAYAEVLAGQAYFLAHLGYSAAGLKQAQESVAILYRLRRFSEIAAPYEVMRYAGYYFEDREQALQLDIRQTIEFAGDANGQWWRAYHKTWQGKKITLRGGYEEARQRVQESLGAFEQLGDALATVWPRFELGGIAVLQDDFSEAQDQFRTILRVAQAGDFGWPKIKAARYLGNVATVLGEYQEARDYLLASLRLSDELGMIRDVVSALYDLAAVEAKAGDKEMAVRWLAVVHQHPLSNQTRTFSRWTRDPMVRFCDLADALLVQLRNEMPPAAYAAALADGRALELDTAVLGLLAEFGQNFPQSRSK